MGMVNNNCEIWGFQANITTMDNSTTTACATVSRRGRISLHPTRLQCITCNVRCMTYSISFYGWDGTAYHDCNRTGSTKYSLPSLVVGSGTVFGEIVIWGAVRNHQTAVQTENDDNHLPKIVKQWLHNIDSKSNNNNENTMDRIAIKKTSRIRVSPSYTLKGHLGSVFSVKFSDCGNYIASTSDDRSVRLWKMKPIDDESATTNRDDDICINSFTSDEMLSYESSHTLHCWTGWGHTARVWDVSFFVSTSSSNQNEVIQQHQLPILVSAGEDSVATVWSPLSSTKEITHPLRGHRCESLWTVNVCEDIVVTGGNDGCVKLFELENRVKSQEVESVRTITVPKDPPLIAPVTVNDDDDADQLMRSDAPTSNASKKS